MGNASREAGFEQTLVGLAHAIGRAPDCHEHVLRVVSETAASALDVDRVNVWRVDEGAGVLRCIHGFDRRMARHVPRPDDRLDLSAPYVASLLGSRVVHAEDVGDAQQADDSLGRYLRRHGVVATMDAPIRTADGVVGVICHEMVDGPRAWTPSERAFAASIGDHLALIHERERRTAAQAGMHATAEQDPTTRLPNRYCVVDWLQALGTTTPAALSTLSVIHLQLDLAACTGGHSADVETVLRTASERLRRAAGANAQLGRIGNDAFLLIPRAGLEEAALAPLARKCLAAVEEGSPFDAGVRCDASAGIAFARDLHAWSPETLLHHAELASRRAQRREGARLAVFDTGHFESLRLSAERENTLRLAFARQEFEVHFQPEVELGTGRVLSAEALLRWQREGRWVAAAEFIEVVEASDMVIPVGRWVLERACQLASRWPDPALRVRVNVSARQFDDTCLVEQVAGALQRSRIQPQRLCLEITETAVMDTVGGAAVLARLRELGVGLAIDDFGTGHSSLAYLKALPIDTIKIDRSFVRALPDDPFDQAILEAVVHMARRLGLEVVAEGVEDERQRAALVQLGVGRAQGFLFSRALPPACFIRFLEQHHAAHGLQHHAAHGALTAPRR